MTNWYRLKRAAVERRKRRAVFKENLKELDRERERRALRSFEPVVEFFEAQGQVKPETPEELIDRLFPNLKEKKVGKNEYKAGKGREGMTFAELRNLVEVAYHDGAEPGATVHVVNGFKGQLLSLKLETTEDRKYEVSKRHDNSFARHPGVDRGPYPNVGLPKPSHDVLGDWQGRNEFGA